MSRSKQEKPIYYGYYGNVRGKWLKENEPDLFQDMVSSGTLESYLDSYQKTYVARSNVLEELLKEQYSVDEALFNTDFPSFIERMYKIHNQIREQLTKEIER